MTPNVRPLIAGNWKMNGFKASLAELTAMREAFEHGEAGVAELALCPPATLIAAAAALAGPIAIGGQDCAQKPSGAFTGDLSAEMLKDAGCTYVIVGHSERRAMHGETDSIVSAKAQAALRAGLIPIICVGEVRAERDAGKALDVVTAQVRGSVPDPARVIIAYEPVWAIGTGLTPTSEDVAQVHATIRALLGPSGARTRLLYGGSVKPSNARELLGLADVDGALVGGASLKAEDFIGIAAAYRF